MIKAINNKGQEVEFKNTNDCTYSNLIKITELPTKLKFLYCYGNQLTSLPTLPTRLMYLSCYSNQLTLLPTLPTKLMYLSCYSNQLTSLPDLRKCKNLKYVDCDLKNFEPYMLEMENAYFYFYY